MEHKEWPAGLGSAIATRRPFDSSAARSAGLPHDRAFRVGIGTVPSPVLRDDRTVASDHVDHAGLIGDAVREVLRLGDCRTRPEVAKHGQFLTLLATVIGGLEA